MEVSRRAHFRTNTLFIVKRERKFFFSIILRVGHKRNCLKPETLVLLSLNCMSKIPLNVASTFQISDFKLGISFQDRKFFITRIKPKLSLC